jgi:leader peptidase (prepilin peptidase)/N-methyltransferase
MKDFAATAWTLADRLLPTLGADAGWGWLTPAGPVPLPFVVLAAVFGLCVGSFLNVVIHRLPRDGSIVWPGSHCPGCARPLAAWENVPLLSFAVLRGRCRGCQKPIGWRYPAIEATGGAIAAFTMLWLGPTPAAVFAGTFLFLLLAIAVVDLEHRIIPDELSAGVLGLGLWARGPAPDALLAAVCGALFGFFLLLLLAAGYRHVRGQEGLGGGDIKLAAGLGAFLGVPGVLLTLMGAASAGALVGLTMMALGRAGPKSALPFGTFLAPAAAAVLIAGAPLWRAYLGLSGTP